MADDGAAVAFPGAPQRTEHSRMEMSADDNDSPSATMMLVEDSNANCVVCCDGGWSEDNKIVFCEGEGCRVVVHQDCYGILQVPEGDIPWYCDVCAWKKKNPSLVAQTAFRCCICDDADESVGVLKYAKAQNAWYHVGCALASPEIAFDNMPRLDGIRGLDSFLLFSRRSMQCLLCSRRRGACVMCMHPGCKATFHVKCGQAAGCHLELKPYATQKEVYCAVHNSVKRPAKRKRRTGGASKSMRARRNAGSSPRKSSSMDDSPRRSRFASYTWDDVSRLFHENAVRAKEENVNNVAALKRVFLGSAYRTSSTLASVPLGRHYASSGALPRSAATTSQKVGYEETGVRARFLANWNGGAKRRTKGVPRKMCAGILKKNGNCIQSFVGLLSDNMCKQYLSFGIDLISTFSVLYENMPENRKDWDEGEFCEFASQVVINLPSPPFAALVKSVVEVCRASPPSAHLEIMWIIHSALTKFCYTFCSDEKVKETDGTVRFSAATVLEGADSDQVSAQIMDAQNVCRMLSARSDVVLASIFGECCEHFASNFPLPPSVLERKRREEQAAFVREETASSLSNDRDEVSSCLNAVMDRVEYLCKHA